MRSFPVVLLVLVAACARVPEGVVFRCEPDGGCPDGLACRTLQDGPWCVPVVAVDAGGPSDAGRDAGQDSGISQADAGLDAGVTPDAGAGDSGVVDAGALDDAGPGDAGAIDAGEVDAGPSICATACASCGVVVGGCLCGCTVGRTCSANVCELPRLCEGAWCYEHPLPQGGHLLAAWANSQRPLVRGVTAAAWGGERGIIFEWDGYETVIGHLPSREGSVVGIFTSPTGLRAVTNLAEVYERTSLGWRLVIPSPITINDGGTTWHDPCPAFANTTQGVFLACVDMGGTLQVLRHGGTLWEVEPTGITSPRPVTFGEVGGQLLLSCMQGGDPKQLRRIGTTWVEEKAPNQVSPVSAYASIAGKSYAAIEYGGLGLSHGPTDAGSYTFTDEAIFEGRFAGAVRIATQQVVMFGDSLGVIHTDGGFARTPGAGKMVLVREPTALHERRWLAGAAMPEGLLVVGAFGATAFFRLDTTSVTASSTFSARPTDLCGVPGTEQVFATYSATWGEPTFFRPDDLLLLDETWSFKALAQRDPAGQWVATPDARGRDAGWKNSLDQCWVDEAGGLSIASPYGFSRFFDGGVRSPSLSTAAWTNDAGMVQPTAWRGFWSNGRNSYAIGGGAIAVVNGMTRDIEFAPVTTLTGQVSGLGVERLFSLDVNSTSLFRLFDGEGLTGATLNEGPANQRAALFGVADGGVFVMLQQDQNGVLRLAQRRSCDAGGCPPFDTQFTAPRQATYDVVSHLWVSPEGRSFWLRYSDGRAIFNGAYFTPRSSMVTLEWPLTSDGGVGTSALPGWIYDVRSDLLPLDLWGTPTRLLVKTNRGIVSRSVPP